MSTVVWPLQFPPGNISSSEAAVVVSSKAVTEPAASTSTTLGSLTLTTWIGCQWRWKKIKKSFLWLESPPLPSTTPMTKDSTCSEAGPTNGSMICGCSQWVTSQVLLMLFSTSSQKSVHWLVRQNSQFTELDSRSHMARSLSDSSAENHPLTHRVFSRRKTL